MKYFVLFLIFVGFTGLTYADDSLFEHEILPIHLETNNIELRNVFDWTSDGKILFRAELEDDTETLVVVSIDGTIVRQLNITSIDNPSFTIIHAQIDPTDDNIIHFLKNHKLYRYLLDKDKITELDTDGYKVEFFDYYSYSEDDPSKHMIAYSVEDVKNPKHWQLFSMRDSHEEEPEQMISELMSDLEDAEFQLSPNGKKILFQETLKASYGYADRRIAYLGAQDYGPYFVSDLNTRCGNFPKWHPSGELIVYHISYCGRGAPGGILGMINLDGTNQQILLPDNNDNPRNFAINRDGSIIAVLSSTNGKSYGEVADFYLLNLLSFEKGTIFPRHGNPPDVFTPLQHERNGTPFNQMQCRNDDHVLIQKYDDSPVCVTESTKQKLIERGWTESMGDIVKQRSGHSESELLDQLRKTPRIESMQNFTDTARDFVVSEALYNLEVSNLLLGSEYEVRCCTFSFDRNDTSYNRYVGLVFDVPEKYMKVVVTYDLVKQQISGVGTEILVEDGIIKVGEKENEK